MAVSVDKAYLVLHFPEFSDVDETRITSLNPTGLLYVSEDCFGDAAQYALALIIAHIIKLGEQAGSGPLKSEKVGDLSRSYGDIKISDWSLTSYGAEFEMLAKMKCRGKMFVPSYDSPPVHY
jgi:hypothetical protein